MFSPRLPNFIYIGLPKAASTWVFKPLATHPQVFTNPAKETYFFDRYYSRGVNWYASHFRGAANQRIVAEVCHDYLYLPLTAETLGPACLWGAGYRSVREDGLLATVGFLVAVFVRPSQLGRAGEGAGWLIGLLWIGQAIHGLSADIHSLWIAMPSAYLLTGLALQPRHASCEPAPLTAPPWQPEPT